MNPYTQTSPQQPTSSSSTPLSFVRSPNTHHGDPQETSSAALRRTKKSRACDLCRRKKIRCDYDQMLPQRPCTSCHSYGKFCTFDEAAKKRGPPKGYVEGLESRLRRMEKLLVNIASSGNFSSDALRDMLGQADDHSHTASPSPSFEDSDHEPSSTPSASASPPPQSRVTQRKRSRASSTSTEPSTERKPASVEQNSHGHPQEESDYSYMGSSSGVYMLNKMFPDDDPDNKKCKRNRPLQGNEDDIMIARFDHTGDFWLGTNKKDKAPWELPHQEVVDRLVEIYFTQVNVFLPIIDESYFMDQYRHHYQTLSQPLLFTVCRAASRLLSDDDPVAQKHGVRHDVLFRNLSDQLQNKYELDFLKPSLDTIQVLLLGASCARTWGSESQNWLGTSIAVKMAQDLGLHRSNTQLNMRNQESGRRLWWSAYVIDRWVSAALGRPLMISDADCDVEYPATGEDPTFSVFIPLVKLSAILGDVLRKLYSPRARAMYDKRIKLEAVADSVVQRLKDWKASLPSHLVLTEDELHRLQTSVVSPSLRHKMNHGAGQLTVAGNIVHLMCQCPYVAKADKDLAVDRVPMECIGLLKLNVSILAAMDVESLFSFGWSLSSYCLLQTQMMILWNHKNVEPKVGEEARQQSQELKTVFTRLEKYIPDRSIVPFLEGLTKYLNDEDLSKPTADDASSVQPTDANHSQTFFQLPVEQQRSFWGAFTGMDWQEMNMILAQAGYQF
ncbi:fungal-specific transcription factor domain-containing protein [Radiomyces spectabilis]|uniref:fungal-specific transcription factor domain-containing protein n=1 Tax=Radiomyces spectabilis TaxID=64574 RepID=UPI00221E8DFE|nr:fungal-specific transcription factor domain-containing protein [Radiomyces spectabilis]KAI8365979.1 fungal-specific transcription factor domain-containing protein [Radiomyces spectabilis]